MKKTTVLLTLLLLGTFITNTFGAEEPSCSVCLENYTDTTIAIQLDCNQSVNHHTCLGCANEVNDLYKKCPLCRADFKVHNPLIGSSYKKIHHLYRELSSQEQTQLQKLLASSPTSALTIPNALNTICRGCSTEHDSEVLVRFTCTHAFCLPKALKLAQSGTKECPICKKQLRLVDPIKNENGYIELMYYDRIALSSEQSQLNTLRSYSHIPIYQDHIPTSKRVPISKKEKSSQPNAHQDNDNNNSQPEELPEIAELFPNIPLSDEDIRLTNTYLPAHLSKKIWQVLLMPNGTYARARRAQELPQWPPCKNKKRSSLTDLLGRHVKAGLLCGLLVGPEYKTGNPLMRRLLYIPALAYSGFGLYESYNNEPDKTLRNSCKWVAGFAAGLLAYSWKNKTEKE